MNLASGLCHYCTMGLPPEKLFYLYIPVGCLDLSLLLRTDGDGSACEAVSIILFSEDYCSVRTGQLTRWRQRATYCEGNLSYGLRAMAGLTTHQRILWDKKKQVYEAE